MIVTSDWSKFGYREIEQATDLLSAYKNRRWTKRANDYFDWSSMKPAFNTSSGYVFLTDDDYNVVMLNDNDDLDLWISTPYEGHEGFYNDLIDDIKEYHEEDQEYLKDMQGHFGVGKNNKRKYFGKTYDTGGLFNLFPDLTKNARGDLKKAYKKGMKDLPPGTELMVAKAVVPELALLNNYTTKNKIKQKSMNGCDINGFSRVVVPGELNGFTRVNMILPENLEGYALNEYELDGYTLNGRTTRKVSRWYKKNAPYSYIGTALAGIVIADILTKGAVRKKLGLKKGR